MVKPPVGLHWPIESRCGMGDHSTSPLDPAGTRTAYLFVDSTSLPLNNSGSRQAVSDFLNDQKSLEDRHMRFIGVLRVQPHLYSSNLQLLTMGPAILRGDLGGHMGAPLAEGSVFLAGRSLASAASDATLLKCGSSIYPGLAMMHPVVAC
jgi:hypothetical protein